MKFAFCSLGCKANQCETASLEYQCVSLGHEVVPFSEKADVYVINTCAVTASGCRKSRTVVHSARKNAPNSIIAVCGCYSQMNPQELVDNGADIVFGTADKAKIIPQAIAFAGSRSTPQIFASENTPCTFEQLSGSLSERTRAYLKIEDGCNNFCTYCIIPHVRGRVRSASREFILSELDRLCKEGYKEVVLTGIEICSYGNDTGDNLIDLLKTICTNYPSVRFRLGSLEPRTITEEFCAELSGFGNLCNHFHLSLQSGCDATLKRMGRRYDTSRFYQSVRLLRENFPNCGITTDLIVGFPGETEEEFAQTMQFIEKCGFSSMHIFPYSRREGTPADKMQNQLTKAAKDSRAKQASEIAQRMHDKFSNAMVGQTLSVIFERNIGGNVWIGHSSNYCEVTAKSESDMRNIQCNVEITANSGNYLCGNISNV